MAIAVPDLDKAKSLYRDILGAEVSETVVRELGGGAHNVSHDSHVTIAVVASP